MTAAQKMQNLLKSLETKQLIEVVTDLFNNDDDSADLPLDYALSELSNRMTQEQFAAFSEAL